MYTPVLDLGFSFWKFLNQRKTAIIPNAIHPLSNAEWARIIKQSMGRPGPDYVQINGQAYAVGKTAERHGIVTRPKGAARYTPDYYGVALAAMLARIYPASGNVTPFLGHPPRDAHYTDQLIQSVLGHWHIIIEDQEKGFYVESAATYPEALGGLMNVVLNEGGQDYARSDLPIQKGFGLLIDIGGHTINMLAAAPGGRPDYSVDESIPMGVDDALQNLEGNIRESLSDDLQLSRNLRPERLRQALQSGEFQAGGRVYDVENEAQQALWLLLNDLANAYQEEADGPAPWDYIVVTGGGGGLLFDRLVANVLRHDLVVLADDPANVHLANVRGGEKIRQAIRFNERA